MRTQINVLDPARTTGRARQDHRKPVRDIPIPKELGAALAVTTDDKGRAFLSGLVPDEILVEAPGFGVQTMTILSPGIPGSKIPDSKVQAETERTITLTLAPSGKSRVVLSPLVTSRSRA